MGKYTRLLLEKYESIPKAVKASLWFLICSILQKGISFITIPLFTRMMTTEQYGAYSQYVSWYSILLVFTSLSLYNGVFNNALIKYEGKIDEYVSSMQGLISIITLICFGIYLLNTNSWNKILAMPTVMVVMLFAELLVTPSFQFWFVKKRFDYEYRAVVIVTLIKSIINPILGIVLVSISDNKDVARVLSIVVVEIAFCGYLYIYQFCKGKTFCNLSYWKFAVLFNLPLIPHYLAGSILNQGDRVMIAYLVGKDEVAFYSVANSIGQVLNIVIVAITATYTPWIYKKFKQKATSDIAELTNGILYSMVAMLIIIILLGPEIIRIMASSEYAEAKYVIAPVSGSAFFILLYNMLANVEFYYGKRKYVLIGSCIAAAANIILNYVFILKYGYYAAGYTTLFCYIVYGLSHLYFGKKIARREIGEQVHIYDDRTILLLSLFIVVFSSLATLLYDYYVIRYILVFVCLIVFVIKRKYVIEQIKKMRD